MSDKKRMNAALSEAARLRASNQFTEARKILQTLRLDPASDSLGHKTSLGLPRRLQSALLKLAKAEKNAVESIAYQYHLVPPPSLLGRYSTFNGSQRADITAANKQAVPRKIHQIWIGPNKVPAGASAWEAHAQRHGYQYCLWREEKLHELGVEKNPVYQDMLARGDFPGAVDVARYLILEQQGGIYLDCDWYPARDDVSFHDFLPLSGLNAMAENIPRNTGKGGLLLANSMIASPAHHPVFTRLIAVLNEVMSDLPKAPAWWVTGPLIFTLISRGSSLTLVDADFVAGALPQETPLADVDAWCQVSQANDGGLLLAWKSWIWA